MRNILNINSDWILSTEKTPDGKAVHKRILPLNKEDEYCYYLELLGATPSMEVFVNQEKIGDHTGSYTLYRVDVTCRHYYNVNICPIIVQKSFEPVNPAGIDASIPQVLLLFSQYCKVSADYPYLPKFPILSSD